MHNDAYYAIFENPLPFHVFMRISPLGYPCGAVKGTEVSTGSWFFSPRFASGGGGGEIPPPHGSFNLPKFAVIAVWPKLKAIPPAWGGEREVCKNLQVTCRERCATRMEPRCEGGPRGWWPTDTDGSRWRRRALTKKLDDAEFWPHSQIQQCGQIWWIPYCDGILQIHGNQRLDLEGSAKKEKKDIYQEDSSQKSPQKRLIFGLRQISAGIFLRDTYQSLGCSNSTKQSSYPSA